MDKSGFVTWMLGLYHPNLNPKESEFWCAKAFPWTSNFYNKQYLKTTEGAYGRKHRRGGRQRGASSTGRAVPTGPGFTADLHCCSQHLLMLGVLANEELTDWFRHLKPSQTSYV